VIVVIVKSFDGMVEQTPCHGMEFALFAIARTPAMQHKNGVFHGEMAGVAGAKFPVELMPNGLTNGL
jgi:hypothetical protein